MPRHKKIQIKCAHTNCASINEITEHPRNPNVHSEEQIEILMRLLKKHGWRLPLTVSKRSGYLIRGHGRLEAAKRLGEKTVPIDRQNYANDEDEFADLMADNFADDLSAMDYSKVSELVIDLKATGYDLAAIGLYDDKLNKLLGIGGDSTDEMGLAGDDSDKLEQSFAVLIECDNEENQIEILTECEAKGWRCRALT